MDTFQHFPDCIYMCVQLTITQNPEAEPSDEVLPVSYPKFTSMCQKGDMIFVGRYLVTGSEDSSLYVTVSTTGLLGVHGSTTTLCQGIPNCYALYV